MEDGLTYTSRSKILEKLGFDSYSDYVESDMWKDVCESIMGEDTKCSVCGEVATILHHDDYSIETLRGDKTEGLFPLCKTCHFCVEFRTKKKKRRRGKSKKYKKCMMTEARQRLRVMIEAGSTNVKFPEPRQKMPKKLKKGQKKSNRPSDVWIENISFFVSKNVGVKTVDELKNLMLNYGLLCEDGVSETAIEAGFVWVYKEKEYWNHRRLKHFLGLASVIRKHEAGQKYEKNIEEKRKHLNKILHKLNSFEKQYHERNIIKGENVSKRHIRREMKIIGWNSGQKKNKKRTTKKKTRKSLVHHLKTGKRTLKERDKKPVVIEGPSCECPMCEKVFNTDMVAPESCTLICCLKCNHKGLYKEFKRDNKKILSSILNNPRF